LVMVTQKVKHTQEEYREMVEEMLRIRAHPWYFLQNYVWTEDPVDKINPIKRFPCHLPHLEYITNVWMEEKLCLFPKSRRMIMSWWAVAVHLWGTMFFPSRHTFFVSMKEELADELIDRAFFIYNRIPEKIMPFKVPAKRTYCKLAFPSIRSLIQGVPQGSDQLRQRTSSYILADEMAFWEKARDTYTASIPTLEGGGKFTGISTAYPGFYKKLVFDELIVA